jgi:hypothetical protein
MLSVAQLTYRSRQEDFGHDQGCSCELSAMARQVLADQVEQAYSTRFGRHLERGKLLSCCRLRLSSADDQVVPGEYDFVYLRFDFGNSCNASDSSNES